MKLLLKVCGMTNARNIEKVSAHKPDFMGFIFYPKSKRYVGEHLQLDTLNPEIKRVGVFVNETVDRIMELVQIHKLDLVQLHGNESLDHVKTLKKSGISVIKVISVGETLPADKIQEYEKDVDYFLFDTKTPEYGGSGKQFNWNLLRQYSSKVPYFLSGGVRVDDPATIKVLQLPGLIGIDMNSKLEWKVGFKRPKEVKKVKAQIG